RVHLRRENSATTRPRGENLAETCNRRYRFPGHLPANRLCLALCVHVYRSIASLSQEYSHEIRQRKTGHSSDHRDLRGSVRSGLLQESATMAPRVAGDESLRKRRAAGPVDESPVLYRVSGRRPASLGWR